MIDTREIGGGSYPEPQEPKYKCYKFEFNAKTTGYGIVYAKDRDDAMEKLSNGEYDDIIDIYDTEVEEITSLEEE